MTRLLLLLLLPVLTVADERLLICGGHTIDTWNDGLQRTSELNDALSIFIGSDYVETAGVRSKYRYRDEKTWVWAFDVEEETWIYELKMRTGRLKKTILPKGKTRPVIAVALWYCNKPD